MPRLLPPALALAIVLISGFFSYAQGVQAPATATTAGEIVLPHDDEALGSSRPAPGKAAAEWDRFRKQHPGWTASWNRSTDTPHRAFGSGIPVTGRVDSADQATRAAQSFLARYSDLTKAAAVELESAATLKGGRVWYAHFRQLYQGLPVMLTDITVRLGEDGKVFAFGSDARVNIDLDPRPRYDAAAARLAASTGLTLDPQDQVTGGDELSVLPLDRGDQTEYRLVRRVEITQTRVPHRWVSYVDAHTAEVVWRFDRVRYGQVSGNVTSSVHLVLPTDPLETDPNANTYVNVNGVDVTTDALGAYLAEGITGTADLGFELAGPWAKTFRQDGGNEARVDMTVDADTNPVVDLHWDNTNSHSNERDAYHATVRTHDYIRAIDPGFTNMDYQMPVNVLLDGSCNAFWNGISINFFRGGGGCQSTAKMVDVVAHEYGHAINDLLYQQAGAPNGMTSGALHEGMADVNAAFLTDDPVVGDGFFLGDGDLRNIDNTNNIPNDITGSIHTNGQIIGGAFWDLRESVGLATAERLAHFARYGTPDHPTNLRLAFREYLIEVLIADDDDSDLSNETPNWNAILTAFSAHGITPALFVQFDHDVLPDTDNTDDDIMVEVDIRSDSASFPLDPGSTSMTYRINRDTPVTVAMTAGAGDSWTATIPAQTEGTIVSYWFEASILGESRFRPALFGSRPHQFYVGSPTVLLEDDFETDQGWTAGQPGDDAQTGQWERGEPQGLFDPNSGAQVRSQTGFDHTLGDGTFCYVTGAAAGDGPGSFDVDEGKTTLLSPVYDLSTAVAPAITYYRFFTNNILRNAGGAPPSDPWLAEVTSDGVNWVPIENTLDSNVPADKANDLRIQDWQRVAFRVDSLVPASATVQLRFTVVDQDEQNLVEGMLDDLLILDFEQAAVPVAVANFQASAQTHGQRPVVSVAWRSPPRFAASQFRLHAVADRVTWIVPEIGRDEFGKFTAVDRHQELARINHVTYELAATENGQDWVVVASERIELSLPQRVALHQPWPNPFNPRTNVAFSLDVAAQVDLAVFDATGRRVATLTRGPYAAGRHEVAWTGHDEQGHGVASGVYYVLLRADGHERGRQKLVLTK